MTLYKGFQSVFEFQWWPSLPEETFTLTGKKICSYQRRKMRLGKRIRKKGARIVLGIAYSVREDCSHLLMDWQSQSITPGGLSLFVKYIALAGKKKYKA